MDSAETADHLDVPALEALLRELRQGDILDVAKLPTLYSPDSPMYPAEIEGVEAQEPVMTMQQLLRPGLSVVVSQTCDIRRLPDTEPYLLISPLTTLEEGDYEKAADRLSVRYFAYPGVEGYEDHERLALDARVISSLEKAALLSPHVKRIECPFSDPDQARLRFWLGQRLGRPVFTTEIAEQVVTPVEQALKRVHERGAQAAFYGSVIYYGLSYTPGRAYCSLLLLTDPALRSNNGVGEGEVKTALKKLQQALDHWAGKSGSYTIVASAHDATKIPASELLQHHQLDLEIADVDVGG